MATSSGIIQSFLRDSLNLKKDVDDLSFADLLAYNRDECGLIKLTQDQIDSDFENIKKLCNGKNAVCLVDEQFYYIDITGNKPKKLTPTNSDQNDFKKKFPDSYKIAKGADLQFVMSITGRAFSEHRSNDFLPSLNFYLDILDNTDKVMFDYMSSEQKEQLRFDLKITLLLLLAQQQHEIDYQQTENTKKYRDSIRQCAQLLEALDPEFHKS
ncbi:MAG: hypothetical protein HYX60_09705, partial [Legionella longbeachae]|nr:hypothetical protein [Legionella longbeachae]